MSIINRYILREHAPPFVLTIALFIMVMFTARLMKLSDVVFTSGVKPMYFFEIFLYLMPYLLVYALPAATLVSVLVVFLRMAGDQEITALKASGVGLLSIISPVLLVAGLAFAFSSCLNIWMVPLANRALKNTLIRIAKGQTHLAITEGVFNDSIRGVLFYVRKVDQQSGRLQGIFISDERDPKVSTTIVADSGTVFPDERAGVSTLRLFSGKILRVEGDLSRFQGLDFNTYDFQLATGDVLPGDSGRDKGLRELTIGDINERLAKAAPDSRDANTLKMQYHKKFAIPFACIVLGFLGFPLGVQARIAGRYFGVAAALVLFLMYYLFLTAGWSLGENGNIPPLLGMWFPNGAFTLVGVYLFFAALKDRPVDPLGLIARGIGRVRDMLAGRLLGSV